MSEKNYTYEVTENGYYISIDGKKVIHQYEPFIPDKNLSYEENAKKQIKEMQENDYAQQIINNEITIENVPEEMQENVNKIVKQYEENEKKQPATKEEITDLQLALAEVYEMMLGGMKNG